MAVARLTTLRIAGLRTLADVTLSLDGLTVLIGDNGTGKSSIIEALELVRCLPRADGLRHLREIHGPPSAVLRLGAASLSFALGFEHDGVAYAHRLPARSEHGDGGRRGREGAGGATSAAEGTTPGS